jgi:protein-tyrosine phosphatase
LLGRVCVNFILFDLGKGRSAVIIIAYVAAIKGWDVREAFDFVKSKRSIVANLPALGVVSFFL